MSDTGQDPDPSEAQLQAPDQVVDAMSTGNRISDPDYVVGLCTECKSVQPESRMRRSPFAQAGQPVPCGYCGGVVIVTYGELLGEALNRRLDQSRGIDHIRNDSSKP